MTCKHESLYWYPAPATEQGWKCADCKWQPGEPPGYSPQHDRSHLETKVWCVLNDLHNHEIVYVSNGSAGDGIVHDITATVRRSGKLDQYSIALAILKGMTPSHAKYWRETSIGILKGQDPRHRCACGKLATSYSGTSSGEWLRQCSECSQLKLEAGGEP
jgi:hypothetical protein